MIGTLCDNVQSNDTAMLFSHSNREMMKKRIPNMVITVGQILVGVSGNAFVIHIYRKNSSLRSRLLVGTIRHSCYNYDRNIFHIAGHLLNLFSIFVSMSEYVVWGHLLYIIWSIMFTSHCVPKILLRISEASAYA